MFIFFIKLTLGMFLFLITSYIFVFKLIVEGISEKIQHKKRWSKLTEQQRKRKLRQQEKNNPTKPLEKFVEIFILTPIMISIFLGVIYLGGKLGIPPTLDLPRVITNSPATIEGTVDSSVIVDMSGRSWGYPYGIEIDGVHYSSLVYPDVVNGEKITVKYYPSEKLIVEIENK